MKLLAVLLSAFVTIPAFSGDKFVLSENKLRGAFVNILKDPDSAVFRNIRIKEIVGDKDNSVAICGDLNSRNEFGGYTGYAPFMVGRMKRTGKSEEYIAIGVGPHIPTVCASEGL